MNEGKNGKMVVFSYGPQQDAELDRNGHKFIGGILLNRNQIEMLLAYANNCLKHGALELHIFEDKEGQND